MLGHIKFTLVLAIGSLLASLAYSSPVDPLLAGAHPFGPDFAPSHFSHWLSVRPYLLREYQHLMSGMSPSQSEQDLSLLLQYLQKRSAGMSTMEPGMEEDGQRDIRSPLGTMRFGKRSGSPLGTMRFGKRSDGLELGLLTPEDPLSPSGEKRANDTPLGTMRFGKRGESPLGTMRFGKRGEGPLGTMRFGKRGEGPLGTMRFGKRSVPGLEGPDETKE